MVINPLVTMRLYKVPHDDKICNKDDIQDRKIEDRIHFCVKSMGHLHVCRHGLDKNLKLTICTG